MSGFAVLAHNYDGFIVDLWGVVHNGIAPYPGAVDCLTRLRAAGKPVVFLSNAPRRAASVGEALDAMGIGPALYAGIMSSGEAVHAALRDRTDEFAGLGRRLYHLGPMRDRDVFAGLDLTEVERPADADFLLNTGPDDILGPQDPVVYVPVLTASRAAGLPMVCANPDLEVVRDGQRIICAGWLAEMYEDMGGEVILRGKPDPAIYAPTLGMLGLPAANVLAVGDSLRTDIAGAKAAGIAALWVLSGIHALHPDEAAAEAAARGLHPVAIQAAFAWV
ncbi:MAG: TIGR01459 family HAD-type hydrolase [Acidocella sp.]|nr:TIGR01459 family HAD-type hydrolase [Acidocella sp.]